MANTKKNTEAALLSVVHECLSNPEKQEVFVNEGSVDLLLALCNSEKDTRVKAFAAGTLAVLCHKNNTAKAQVVGHGGVPLMINLCRAQERENCNLGDPLNSSRLLSHEHAAAVLQKLAFENTACQNELIKAGAIRHLVKLCDVFNPDGSHGNCCQVMSEYSPKANELFMELTRGQKLIAKVNKLGEKATLRTAMHLLNAGLDFNVLSGIFNKIHQINLYDTTQPGIDIKLSDELIDKGLAWPDMSTQEASDARNSKQDSNSTENSDKWLDIAVQEVIDAGHFWAHVGHDKVIEERIEQIQKFLLSQELQPLSCSPEPGDIICVSASTSGHRDYFRACVVDYTSTGDECKAKVFAIDNGFTAIVPGSNLFTVPRELADFPPQISLCSLAGVQVPPQHAGVLEYAAGALRNLAHGDVNNVAYVATAGGIEALLKLCSLPSKPILVQALGALDSLAMEYKYRARIGFLGGVKILLDLCEKHSNDEDLLVHALGCLQTMMVECIINRSRVAEAHGLHVLLHLHMSTSSDATRSAVLGTLRSLVKGFSGPSSIDPSTGRPRQVLDIRNILDDSVEQAKFSLSVSTAMDGYQPAKRISSEQRRRNRRTKQMVEPKPTHRSLSLENIWKSRPGTSDSSDSGSDDEYGGRWTSETDGETDAEPLLMDSSTLPKHFSQLAELKSERYWVQTHRLGFLPDETHDFRSQTNIHDVSKRAVAKSLCAFLNSKTNGTVYVGVNKDGVVAGVKIRRKERDLLRLGIDEMMDRFSPPIKHDMYKIEFVPIVRPSGSESSITRHYIDDRFIVEISVCKCTGLVYTSPNGRCYFRHKSSNIELSTQEVREKTIDEQESIYNSEIKQLRKQLKDMKKQLSRSDTESTEPPPAHVPTSENTQVGNTNHQTPSAGILSENITNSFPLEHVTSHVTSPGASSAEGCVIS